MAEVGRRWRRAPGDSVGAPRAAPSRRVRCVRHEPFGPEPRLGARDLLAEPVDLGVPAVTRACPLRTDDGGEDPRRPYPRHRDHHQNRLALGPGGAARPATAARRRRYPTTNASTYRPCSAGTSHPALDRGSRGRRDRRARARVLTVSAAARPGRRLPFGPRSPIADIGWGLGAGHLQPRPVAASLRTGCIVLLGSGPSRPHRGGIPDAEPFMDFAFCVIVHAQTGCAPSSSTRPTAKLSLSGHRCRREPACTRRIMLCSRSEEAGRGEMRSMGDSQDPRRPTGRRRNRYCASSGGRACPCAVRGYNTLGVGLPRSIHPVCRDILKWNDIEGDKR